MKSWFVCVSAELETSSEMAAELPAEPHTARGGGRGHLGTPGQGAVRWGPRGSPSTSEQGDAGPLRASACRSTSPWHPGVVL